MKNILLLLSTIILLVQCRQEPKELVFEKTISLDSIAPVGIDYEDGKIWISDGLNNQLIAFDSNLNKVLEITHGLERPMHLQVFEGKVFIPEYASDRIFIQSDISGNDTLPLSSQPDAPAAIAINEQGYAIADFYNHRIILQQNGKDLTFGYEGHEEDGQFYYPTDVQFYEDRLFVADAYNNRIQVFDLEGKHHKTFGETEQMNAATGLYVSEDLIYVTDFENSRLLIYNQKYGLHQIITEGLQKPIDVIQTGNSVLVNNYEGKSVSIYKFQQFQFVL